MKKSKKNRATPIHQYSLIMKEIKNRMKVIDFFLYGAGHAIYPPTTIESICLQFRKILELIAMASLVANKKQYVKLHRDFAKHWNAEYLLRDLGRLNPSFYPRPITESPSDEPGVKSHISDIEGGYLTKKDFIVVYKKCGGLLHADNPLGRKSNYKYFEKVFPEWYTKIMTLLNCHTVKIHGFDGYWLIHMKEDADDEVHYYIFEPIGVPSKQ